MKLTLLLSTFQGLEPGKVERVWIWIMSGFRFSGHSFPSQCTFNSSSLQYSLTNMLKTPAKMWGLFMRQLSWAHRKKEKYQLSTSIYSGEIRLVKLSRKKNKLWRTSRSALGPALQDKWTLISFASKNHAATCQTQGMVYQTTTAGSLEISQTAFLYVQLDKCNSPSPTFVCTASYLI